MPPTAMGSCLIYSLVHAAGFAGLGVRVVGLAEEREGTTQARVFARPDVTAR